MNSCVCPSGAGDPYFLAGQPAQGCFYLALNRSQFRLPLETGEIGSIILNGCPEAPFLR